MDLHYFDDGDFDHQNDYGLWSSNFDDDYFDDFHDHCIW